MSKHVPSTLHSVIREIATGALDARELPVDSLAEICSALNLAYRAGEPMVTDREYDDLFVAALRQIAPDHSFLNSVEPEPDADFGGPTVRHASPMLSTDKSYTVGEIEAFFRRIDKTAESLDLDPETLTYRVTCKLDGIAGHDNGHVLATRGNGLTGSDISHVIDRGFEMVGGRGLGAGELVIDQDYFATCLQEQFDLKHPRNFIAGLAGAKTIKEHHRAAASSGALQFVPYSTLPAWTGTAADFLSNWLAIFADLRADCAFLADGIVLELVGPAELKAELGSTSHHHRWQVAIKQKGEMAETVVESIRLQTGRSGRITPVLEIPPTVLEGATIRNVTAHTAATLAARGLGVGARIVISRAGSVVPSLESVIEPARVVMSIDACPSCGAEPEIDGEYMVCPNTSNCAAQTENRLKHWFSTLGNVDLFGPVTLAKLVAAGHANLWAVYALSAQDFLDMGFGPGQSQNLVDQLERSRRDPIPDWRWLAAFGVRHLGRGDSRKLLEVYPLDGVVSLTADQIAAVPGFGPITSPLIAKALRDLAPMFGLMRGLDFNLEETPRGGGSEGALTGLSVVFTGTMQERTRDEMIEQARALGATVKGSVSKSTNILVAGTKAGSKLTKAESINGDQLTPVIRIMDERAWTSFLSERG